MSQASSEHYLIFVVAHDNGAAFPASRLQSITCKADSVLLLKFAPGSLGDGQASSVDIVTLAITANKEKEVMKSIFDAIRFGRHGTNYTIVYDDQINKGLSNITACTSITLDS